MPRVLTCKDVVELVTEHLDDALDDPRHRQLAEHLAHCPDCAVYLRQIEQTVAALRELNSAPAAIPDCEALARAFRGFEGDV